MEDRSNIKKDWAEGGTVRRVPDGVLVQDVLIRSGECIIPTKKAADDFMSDFFAGYEEKKEDALAKEEDEYVYNAQWVNLLFPSDCVDVKKYMESHKDIIIRLTLFALTLTGKASSKITIAIPQDTQSKPAVLVTDE